MPSVIGGLSARTVELLFLVPQLDKFLKIFPEMQRTFLRSIPIALLVLPALPSKPAHKEAPRPKTPALPRPLATDFRMREGAEQLPQRVPERAESRPSLADALNEIE